MPVRKRGSQKRKLDTSKNEEETPRKCLVVPPYELLIQRAGLTAEFQQSVAQHFDQQNPFNYNTVMQQFLSDEKIRWEANSPLMLDINKLDSRGFHVFEIILRGFELERVNGSYDSLQNRLHCRQRQGNLIVGAFESYFIHQLQTRYNPALHSGESLLVRLAASFGRFTNESHFSYGAIARKWLQALGYNSMVQTWKDPSTGNGMLAQLAAGNHRVGLNALLSGTCFKHVDMVFDVNSAGQNAIQVAADPFMKRQMEEFGATWSTCFRPFLFDSLVEFLIPDLTNCCLDFIDNGFQSQPPR